MHAPLASGWVDRATHWVFLANHSPIAAVMPYPVDSFAVQAVGPQLPNTRRSPLTGALNLSGTTLEDAKSEAENLLRDLGWHIETASDGPELTNTPQQQKDVSP